MAPAPVEQRESRVVRQSGFVPTVYSVRQGDTLYSIAFRYRLDWREVAAWNRIDAPYLIRPGQALRLVPPPRRLADAPDRSTPAPATRPRSTPTETPTVTRPEPEVSQSPPERAPPVASDRTTEPASEPVSTGPTRRVAGIDWQWPTAGQVSRVFDPAATRRGIGISGREGQPVVAAADGEVVYSGTALIGYGELIIIKHSDTLLSAYAHNRVRLVEEGARIGAGQPIAEMGISDRNEEILHFEVRRNGEPVDPLAFLPRK
jgi:lipoprotein NlpD